MNIKKHIDTAGKLSLRIQTSIMLAVMTFAATSASASTTGTMPWDGPLDAIEQDLQGPVAHGLILVAIVATGLMWAFGEHGSSMRKVMGIAAGGAIALGATSMVTGLGMSTGAVIGF